MKFPTEPIGSIPRSSELLAAMASASTGALSASELEARYDEAVRDTLARFADTGSPVVTDGEQRKPSFATYPIAGMTDLRSDGAVIPFADGHTRQLPLLTKGPFRFRTYAKTYLEAARRHTKLPIKQAVISASALSLLYPADGIADYPRDRFIADLVEESAKDIRMCLEAGADSVQIDFTEGRLALKLDPSGGLLRSFVDLNNQVIERLGADQRSRVGVHTCPGGDRDSTHCADVDYLQFLPQLFQLRAATFYLQLASEKDRARVLAGIREHAPRTAKIFVGVTDPIDPRIETPEEVRDRVLEAAKVIDPERLGTTDDCGFSPFADDTSTSREIAFAKIRARIDGTKLAERAL